MKRLLAVGMFIVMANCTADANLIVWFQMDSASSYNSGVDLEIQNYLKKRNFVANSATGRLMGGITSIDDVYYDDSEKAMRMPGGFEARIFGAKEDLPLFTSKTKYTFSFWAKGDLENARNNGYTFYLKWDDGSEFKADLGWKADKNLVFTAPGKVFENDVYHLWDPAYPEVYINPEEWNMYTFVWDADNDYIGIYINGKEAPRYVDLIDVPAISADAKPTAYGFGDIIGYNGPCGWYRDFSIWNDEALSADEIASIYAKGITDPTSVAEPTLLVLVTFGGIAVCRGRFKKGN